MPSESDGPGYERAAHRIASDGRAVRLRGSAPAHARRRVLQAGSTTMSARGALPPDLPPISTPDVAFQFRPCVPPNLDSFLKDAVMGRMEGAADVRTACVDNGTRLGIWMHPTDGADDARARNEALQALDLLRQGENYAAFINASFIKSRADDEFTDQPKLVDPDGFPDPNGPIHLNSLKVEFQAPNRVVTTVAGFDERPWPDVDFRYITTDTLLASAGQLQVATDHHLDADTSWLAALAAIMGGLGLLSPGMFGIGAIFLAELVIAEGHEAPNIGEGAGAAVHHLPAEIMVPARLKLVMHYQRVQVSDGGIFTGGFMALDLRTPSVSLIGARQIAVQEGAHSVTRSYSVTTSDLRPPLTFDWTADGSVASPNAQATSVLFRLPSKSAPEVGAVLTRNVSVRVSDADGLVQEEGATVELHIVSGDPGDEDGKPPICRIKPWLPQCQDDT
jgi:hypothetical protein